MQYAEISSVPNVNNLTMRYSSIYKMFQHKKISRLTSTHHNTRIIGTCVLTNLTIRVHGHAYLIRRDRSETNYTAHRESDAQVRTINLLFR